jgi:hypothetical protein
LLKGRRVSNKAIVRFTSRSALSFRAGFMLSMLPIPQKMGRIRR